MADIHYHEISDEDMSKLTSLAGQNYVALKLVKTLSSLQLDRWSWKHEHDQLVDDFHQHLDQLETLFSVEFTWCIHNMAMKHGLY